MVYANIHGNWIVLDDNYLIDDKTPYEFAVQCYDHQDDENNEYSKRKTIRIVNRTTDEKFVIPITDMQYKQ